MKNQEIISNINKKDSALGDILVEENEESIENLAIGKRLEELLDEYDPEEYYDRATFTSSQLDLKNYLKEHKNSHQFIANKLIELWAGGTVAEHLEDFNNLNHIELANRLIDEGDGEYVIDNFEKFQNLDQTVIDKLIEKGHDWELAYSLEKFPTIDQESLIARLIARQHWSPIISNWEKFKDINKEKILDELMQNGAAEEILENIKKFPNVDHAILANKLIDENKEGLVVNKIEKLQKLNQAVADKLVAKGKGESVFDNIDRFENLNKETKDKEHIKLREIKQLENPIKEIIKQMDLENTNYDAIIGDDASGRIPALIFNEIISKINKDKKIEKPKLLFIAGQFAGTSYNDADPNAFRKILYDTNKHISKNIKDKKRALIVTDTINTGNSLSAMTKGLQGNKIEYDIASISFLGEYKQNLEEKIKETEKKLGAKIFSNLTTVTPRIYRHYSIAGVRKENASKYSADIMSKRADDFAPASVARARKDIHILSKQLLSWYNNKNSDEEIKTKNSKK
ncbi:MAG: hypothetical protein NTY12_04530 [Candidatus Falkowbacteria bacterium]|nr:hypothetical protein [Candidatus Falkowbacteria bacterium]